MTSRNTNDNFEMVRLKKLILYQLEEGAEGLQEGRREVREVAAERGGVGVRRPSRLLGAVLRPRRQQPRQQRRVRPRERPAVRVYS